MANETPINSNKLYLLSALIKEEAALAEIVTFLKKHELEVKKEENLGSRELTFPINKHRQLILVSIFFTASAPIVKTLESELKHEEYIERFLLTDWKGDLDAAPRKERSKTASARPGKDHV